MKDVKCLKDGKFAIPGHPEAPQISFKEGDALVNILDELADRLIELGYAESDSKVVPKAKKSAAKTPRNRK